jgi:cell wall-associated NlpC family hydrolase
MRAIALWQRICFTYAVNLCFVYIITALAFSRCMEIEDEKYLPPNTAVNASITDLPKDSIQTGKIKPKKLVEYAKALLGTPYLYGSTDPSKGFDCSGFITHVFNHFHIKVPRSSVDFTNVGKMVVPKKAKAGDLILFTGTDSTIKRVGHMGIIVSNDDGELKFIHSSSGKAKGVVITPLENYYKSRFVKIIRVFPNK